LDNQPNRKIRRATSQTQKRSPAEPQADSAAARGDEAASVADDVLQVVPLAENFSTAEPQTARKMRVALVEPRTLIRDFIVHSVMGHASSLAIVAVAAPEDLRDLASDGNSFGAIVLSIGGGRLADRAVQAAIDRTLAVMPGAPLMILADRDEIQLVGAALQRGLKGYLTTSMGLDVTLRAIQLVCTGGTFMPASALQPIVNDRTGSNWEEKSHAVAADSMCPGGLTAREYDVLKCLREGLANKAIAFHLNMSEGTVKVHVRRIMKKLGATNRTRVVSLTNHMLKQTP
jgi:DNA-binding NarL/FixJ family response regulator